MRPLRIGIDVHSIGSRKGGNETYYYELVKALAEAPRNHHFTLYYTEQEAVDRIGLRDGMKMVPLRPAHRSLRIPFTFAWRARRDRLDIFHAQYIVPPFLNCKTVTTIPDIAYEHFPQFFPAAERASLKLLIPWSARRADHVITVSEHSRQDLVKTYGIQPEKISVTYEGAGPAFHPVDKVEAKERLSRKYGIHRDFVLYVGRLQARKNLGRLVSAYAQLRQEGFRHQLVLVGKADSLFEPVLAQIRQSDTNGNIVLPGYVSAEDLPAFYSAAHVFVYPSFYEGFGLPVTEAMACGTPVITSQGSSLEELAGEAAMLIDPLEERSIANALKKLLQQPELARRLAENGLQRSRQFNFSNTAKQTIEVYERLAGGLGNE